MTLLAPAALAALIIPLAIYVIHWLFGTRRRHVVPALFLWTDLPQVSSGRRKRRLPPITPLLLLQLLAAGLGVAALARPAVPAQPPRHLALILDASATMQATDVAPSRFEAARRAADDRIKTLHADDLVSVIRAGEHATLVADGTPANVRQALASQTPGLTAPAIREALALASTRVAATLERQGQIVLFTDGAWPVPDSVGPLAAPVEVVPTGGGSNNQAITAAVVRMDPSGRGQTAFVEVANESDRSVRAPLQLSADGAPFDARLVDVGARSRTQLSIPLPADAHHVVAQLTGRDALALDDRVQVLAPGGPPRQVDLLGRVPDGLRRAIESIPLLRVRAADAKTPADLTVLVGVLPAQLPPGPLLLLDPPANSARLLGVGLGSGARLEASDPLLQGIDLTALQTEVPTISGVPGWAHVVLGAQQGPLLMRGTLEGHPVVSMTFDPAVSGLEKSLAFPLLISNATGYLLAQADPAPIAQPLDAAESDIRPRPLPALDGSAVANPTDRRADVWPWFAAAALLVLGVEWLVYARLSAIWRKPGLVASRALVLGLLVATLAQPTFHTAGRGRAVVFAVDVSDSVTPDQQAWARAWVDQAAAALPAGSQSSVVEFGARAQLAGATSSLPTDSTDLNSVLALAGSIVSRTPGLSPEIVLLTDGWTTAATPAVDSLPSGVAVSYVPLPPPAGAPQPVAVIHALQAPSIARVGERIDVQLDLQASQPIDAELRLSLDQTVVVDGQVHLEAGDTQLSLPAPIGTPGFVSVRADLSAEGQTSTSTAAVVAKPAGRVLVLEDQPSDADSLVSLLTGQGLDVVRRAASTVPPKAEDLSEFDGAVLVNTPATSLTLDQQRTLQSFVQDLGHGLIVVGGSHAFAPGGYEGTVLDDVLPVSATPPMQPQQGSLALFLVIDRSGSMDIVSGGGSSAGGATKMAMAREAAIEAAGLLQPRDTLGVITFDSAFQWVVPPTMLESAADIQNVQSAIASIKTGGGTSILPALQAAYEAAARTDAPLKHIVLMTDGESNDRGYEDLLARMASDHITLSTLAIGSDADTRLLTNLAHLGGGRYYFTERTTQIPRIASKETNILTRNAVVEGQVAAMVADPSPVLRSISGDLPLLSGYVATTPKDRAVTALETEGGHPLLAHWQYGLGRVVAWTSDAQQGWASAWARWPDAAQFWSQTVRWALPAPVQSNFQPTVQVGPDGRQVTLSVQAVGDDGRFADLQDTRATMLAPDGSARQLMLPQRGPGVYAVDTRVSAPGEYRVLFKQGAREEVAAFTAPDAVERHSMGANTALLDQLGTTSGGHALRNPTDLAPGNGPGPGVDLWPYFLALALLLLPIDVFLRRRA